MMPRSKFSPVIFVFILFIGTQALTTAPARAVEGAEVAIFYGPVWTDCVVAFEHFLDWKGLTHERVSAHDVNTHDLRDYYDAIFFPGGDFMLYRTYIYQQGEEHIRDFLSDGGGYIGICGGAYYASDSVSYEGSLYDFPLDLFAGTAYGKLHPISSTYDMTTISLNPDSPLNQFQPPAHSILYAGGSAFYPQPGVEIDTVGTYDEYYGHLAIIGLDYGAGHVLLIGPHPEFEEDSPRDGTSFGDELDDNGSDWGFLWSAMDWVLSRTITDSTVTTSVPARTDHDSEFITLCRNVPNPFCQATRIEFDLHRAAPINLAIHDTSGRLVRRLTLGSHSAGRHSLTWNGRDASGTRLQAGVYFYRLDAGGKSQQRRMLMLE